MVLLLIADLALSLAFKLSAWCLGKTYDGIAYIVTYKSKSNVPPAPEPVSSDCVIITRQEYDALIHASESSSMVESPSS